MKGQIEVGDFVMVSFNNCQITLCHNAEVLHIPSATGDSWIFKEVHNDKIYYVSEGCTITLLEKKINDERRNIF